MAHLFFSGEWVLERISIITYFICSLSNVPIFSMHLIGIILHNLRLIQTKLGGFWQERRRPRPIITRIPLKGTHLYWRREIWCEERPRKKRRRLSAGSWQQKVLNLMIQIVMRHSSQHRDFLSTNQYLIFDSNTLMSPSANPIIL